METKRCVYCHKLQRIDAQICSRCGHAFVQKRTRHSTREWTQPSIPPASPHRAGHYSGLHPEDQPYQSNKIAVQHPTTQDSEDWRTSLPEPEHIILPVTDPAVRRRANIPEHYDEPSAAEFPAIEGPAFYRRKKWFLPRRAIPILLAISCIFFLLASSIFVVVLIKKSPSTAMAHITASPSVLRAHDTLTVNGSGFRTHSAVAFTYDMNRTIFVSSQRPLSLQTNAQGTFSLQLRIPDDWGIGQHIIHAIDEPASLSVSTAITIEQPPALPPALQLSTSNLTFGAAAPVVVSDQMISLINNGGGQITWHASSDQPWLTVSAANNVFSGRENIHIVVNRDALAPASYTGHIIFTPGSNSPLTLTVIMGVVAVPSALVITPSTLPFAMVVGQGAVLKAIILQNSSNQSLNWSASTTTADQGHWLSAEPSSGTLGPGVEGYMNASVNVQGLPPGSYHGTLTLSSGPEGATMQVAILLTVSAS
jgi:Viral BACON domain